MDRDLSELPGDVTRLLQRLGGGDRRAMEQLLPLVYDELRALAASRLRGERPDHTLQPTALVHEAWLRLAQKSHPEFCDRKHFFRTAATVMRCILVDHARSRRRRKRAGQPEIESLPHLDAFEDRTIDLLALDEALEHLIRMAPRQGDIIELRFFAGLTMKEVAEVLGVSERTAFVEWGLARVWLHRELSGGSFRKD